MVKRLNPKNFSKYNEIKENIENLVILYSERIPKDNKMEFDGVEYNLSKDHQSIDLPGSVTDPPRAILKLGLTFGYNLLDYDGDGLLFCYKSFDPHNTGGDSQQLKFQVCRLDIL